MSLNDLKYNTRIAPSPTGNPHVGTIRTAYLNWLSARSSGGKFILRIDDTDKARSFDVYTQNIIDTMKWLGLDYDLIFKQSDRFDFYKQKALQLIDSGKAYYKDDAICFKITKHIDHWKDSIKGNIKITADDISHIDNMVLIKKDGSPTYHFASVLDDIDMNINLIIRGVDHITNTSKHVYLYDAFNVNVPTFTHIGLIFDGVKKISKRDGVASVLDMRLNGYSADAILNLLIKMGWSNLDSDFDKKNPLLDKELALKVFKNGNFKANPSKMDMLKLDWLNKKYNSKAYKNTKK
jgi:glutamyl-tRNA synthetase